MPSGLLTEEHHYVLHTTSRSACFAFQSESRKRRVAHRQRDAVEAVLNPAGECELHPLDGCSRNVLSGRLAFYGYQASQEIKNYSLDSLHVACHYYARGR